MPIIDFPLSQLQEYQGSSPCPQDFHPFWEDSLAQMRAIDSNVELAPAAFTCEHADCYDMTFTGLGGSRIYSKLLRPKAQRQPAPALLKFHGYSANSGDWSHHLSAVAAGFVVAAMDCRGQGGKSQDLGGSTGNTLMGHIVRGIEQGPASLYYRHVFCDTAQLAGLIMAMDSVDADKVVASGGSQGGALALACAALEPRIRQVQAVYPFLSDYRRVWQMDLAQHAYEGIRLYFRRLDPRHEHEDRLFQTLAYVDVQNLASLIRGKAILATGLMDIICPPSTQFAVYNKISAPKEMLLYPDFGHEPLPDVDDLLYQKLLELKTAAP